MKTFVVTFVSHLPDKFFYLDLNVEVEAFNNQSAVAIATRILINRLSDAEASVVFSNFRDVVVYYYDI